MAKELATSLLVSLTALLKNALDLSTPQDSLSKSFRDTLATGTALDQADRLWHDTRTLTATSEDLDLAGGLTDGLGETITFAKVKAVLIVNKNVTAGAILKIGGAAANQFVNWVADASDIVNVQPGGALLLWAPSLAGYGVTADTGDKLKIDSGAATIEYDIVIIGTSA